MAEDHKKSESESESEWRTVMTGIVHEHDKLIKKLQKRVLALEKALTHAQHTNTDDGSRHQNDGGWFD